MTRRPITATTMQNFASAALNRVSMTTTSLA